MRRICGRADLWPPAKEVTVKMSAPKEIQLPRQTENDKQEFLAADTRAGVGPPPHWGERARRPCKQTSLVVDPPNGRIPDLTAEARTRRIPEGAGNNNPRPASWEDFSY